MSIMDAVSRDFRARARAAGIRTLGEVYPDARDRVAPVQTQDNPFKRNDQGQLKNVTAIAQAIRTNEAQAREMCRQAGEPLSKWFPENPR